MNKIELLSPVGDFECLKAAVQNGADAVYLGSSNFSARSSAKNFDLAELEKAIDYAHLRNVKVHLALNTLIKNEEFDSALELAKTAYKFGVDAIIIQDFGLASTLLKYLPDLPLHASTQMSIHNLEGAKKLQNLGFSRVVLSRELSLNEIQFIKDSTSVELEVFIHGALCISYSGQCLMSSLIGGRSGNRGKCAQACRLPYELLEEHNASLSSIDKGYLLSPKDLCGLEYIPDLINMGVSSLKIEGRMKTPEYVATVTRIYRKYIDLAYSGEEYIISEQDKKDLLQVFNRGGFSEGHLNPNPNLNLIYKDKPNNMGIYIGNVSNYNSNKGHITLNLNDELSLLDTITFEHEPSKYRVSELMINNKNVPFVNSNKIVKIGRMKGNIKPGDKIYKLESKSLIDSSKLLCSSELRKHKLNCNIIIQKNLPISIKVWDNNNLSLDITSDVIPMEAINAPITKERILTQFNKTGNTPFEFSNIDIILDDNLYINISDLNELRRQVLANAQNLILNRYKRTINNEIPNLEIAEISKNNKKSKISILLNNLDVHTNYSELIGVDNIYIPLRFFARSEYSNIIKNISNSFNTYIYMPSIIKTNYRNLFNNIIDKSLEKYKIKGFVLSNIGTIEMLSKYKDSYEFIGNYTLNVFNNKSIIDFNKQGINRVCLSCELNQDDIINICNTSSIEKELIVYGRTPMMTCGYCLLGKSNKCYPDCSTKCKLDSKFYLKDRLGFLFRVIPDNIQTVTTIYNSKITSISSNNINIDSLRIDILDENILEINNIIDTVKNGNKLEGKDYTNGNFNRIV